MNKASPSQFTRIARVAFAGLLGFSTLARADGGEPLLSETNHESFTGTVSGVDGRERSVTVQSFCRAKTFAMGTRCRVQLDEKPIAALNDLQPGQRVEVKYLAVDGVLVAMRIIEENAAFTGRIISLDEVGKVLMVKDGLITKAFQVSTNCKFSFRHETGSGFAGLKLGHKVTVRYTPTWRQNAAMKIEARSQSFMGTIQELDAGKGTLKTGHSQTSKSFKVGQNCAIVLGGRTGSNVRDLRVGDLVTCHYEDVDGVLVANRVALEAPASVAPTRATRADASPFPNGPRVLR